MPINPKAVREEFLAEKEALHKRREAIHSEKRLLEVELADIQTRLIAIGQVLEGLEIMESGTPPDLEPLGLTEMVKALFRTTAQPQLPTQIRDGLLTRGYKGSSPRNLLISVHTVISRIGQFLEEVEIDGRKAYKWRGPSESEIMLGKLKPKVQSYSNPGLTKAMFEAFAKVAEENKKK